MKIKNVSSISITFPTGQRVAPSREIFIADATWATLQNDDMVKAWMAGGIITLNGVLPAPPPGTPIKGSVAITQAAYDGIATPDPAIAYFITDSV